MRVLLTHSIFPPDFAGGGEYYVLRIAQSLIDLGVDVRVLTTGDPRIGSFEGVPTTRLPIHPYRMNLAASEVLRHAEGADLIQTFNYHACWPSVTVGRRLGLPVFCGVLGFFGAIWLQIRGPVAGSAFRALERFIATRDYDRVMCLSEHSRDVCVRLGVNRERTFVNYPGIDVDEFDCPADKDDEVLFVGKLDRRKGVDEVLAVARALPRLRFRVVGWGPEEALVRRQAPPNVSFTGFLRGKALRDAFAAARILLLPSQAEGLPAVLLEAMASGCAVVCTLPFQFEGVAVPPGDRAALIAAVERLWAQRDHCLQMGRRNRALAREFSWTRHASALREQYLEVLAAHA